MKYDIKPLGVGEILDQSVKMIQSRFTLFLGISACIAIPAGLIVNFVMLAMMPQMPPNPTPQDMEVFQQAMFQNLIPIMLLSALSMMIVYPLTTGSMIHAVASEYLGKPTTVRKSIAAALKKFFPLLGTSILMFLAVYLGLFLCVIPGLYLLVRYTLSSNVVMLEDKSGPSALSRSSELMLSDRSKNYNTLVLLWLLLGFAGFGINYISNFIPQPHIKIVVTVVIQSLFQAFGAAAFAIFYFSCRCKADNFDLELLADSLNTQPADSAAPLADDLK